MPISVTWDNAEKNIIRLDYTAPVASWQEYDAAVDEANALARSVDYPIANLHNAGNIIMPKGSPIPHIQRALRLAPPNLLVSVIIVKDYFARAILPLILRQPAHPRIVFAHSLEDARVGIPEKIRQVLRDTEFEGR